MGGSPKNVGTAQQSSGSGMWNNLFDQVSKQQQPQWNTNQPVPIVRPVSNIRMAPPQPVLPMATASNVPAGTPTPSLFQ